MGFVIVKSFQDMVNIWRFWDRNFFIVQRSNACYAIGNYKKSKDKTIIMIAHRLKTVRNADQILVVDNGKIVQQGKHDDLIKQQGIYADFVLGRKETIGWKLNAGN